MPNVKQPYLKSHIDVHYTLASRKRLQNFIAIISITKVISITHSLFLATDFFFSLVSFNFQPIQALIFFALFHFHLPSAFPDNAATQCFLSSWSSRSKYCSEYNRFVSNLALDGRHIGLIVCLCYAVRLLPVDSPLLLFTPLRGMMRKWSLRLRLLTREFYGC